MNPDRLTPCQSLVMVGMWAVAAASVLAWSGAVITIIVADLATGGAVSRALSRV